jgi:hypothetical protein
MDGLPDPIANNLIIWALGFLTGLFVYVVIFEPSEPDDDL